MSKKKKVDDAMSPPVEIREISTDSSSDESEITDENLKRRKSIPYSLNELSAMKESFKKGRKWNEVNEDLNTRFPNRSLKMRRTKLNKVQRTRSKEQIDR